MPSGRSSSPAGDTPPGRAQRKETRMNRHEKGCVVVLGPDEGESHWQPLPSRGFITSKLTPYNTPYDSFSMGIQVLEPGAHIRRHAHERQHEVLFCYEGEGWAEIGDQRYDVRPETTILIGRALQHKIQNTGPGQMRMLWMIAPAWRGLPMAPAFDRPADVADVQARM